MIKITGILTIAFVNICIAELKDIKKRCQNKAWIGLIFRYAEAELKEAITKTIYPWYVSGEKDMNDEELKALIDAEDKKHPISDGEIVKQLKEQGIEIARRTVAKYRTQMDIPSSALRKEH